MSDLIKMNDIDFQPLELILRERAPDPMVWTYKKNNNFQAIQDTVKHVTEDHFSKLYEYIYLHSKPLTREISKITRQHFTNVSKKPNKNSVSPRKPYLASYAPQLRITAPKESRQRLNKSCIEQTPKESSVQPRVGNITFVRNSSIDMMSQLTPSDHRAGSVELPSIPQVGGRSSIDIDGKFKGPRIIANEDSLIDITQKGVNQSQLGVPRQSILPSRNKTPNGKELKREPSIVTNLLANPAFKEKYKEKANRARTEGLINMNNPDFPKLIRLITGDEKTQMVQLTKITREQVRAHMLKKYPSEITDRFMQVMDFPSTFDTKTYLESFKALLTDGLDITYFLAFKLFDLNDDGILNHRDIFTLLLLMDEYPCLQHDFNRLLYKPQKKGIPKLAQITAKNLLRNPPLTSAATSNSQDKPNFLVNKNTLTLKVNLLKTLESMISKQAEQKIINLSQLRMVHQTELNVFLNYKRGKYKYTSWADMLGTLTVSAPKKAAPERSNSKVSIQTPSHIGDKQIDFLKAELNISKEAAETISEWGETGLDMVKFVDLFKNDMPYLLYDIVFHCTLADVSSRRYQFSAEDVFDLYKAKMVTDSIINTSGTNLMLNSRNSRGSGISGLFEGKDELETRYTNLTDDR